MIINEKIKIKISKKNIYSYTQYNPIIGESILIDSKNLSKYSHIRIKYECDICKNILSTTYKNYYKTINRKSSIDDLFVLSLCKKCTYIKSKKTMLDKYGSESYSSTILFKQNIINKYGVDNVSQLQFVKDKKSEKSMEKYGVANVFQAEEVKEKSRQTWINNFGFDNPTKSPDIFHKAQMSAYKKYPYKDTELVYQGSYELDFIEYCVLNSILLANGPSINYTMQMKDRTYHSDFYLPDYNLICEIKSTYTMNDDYEENILKREYSIKSGYNFLFIIDKDYTELKNFISNYEKNI